MKLRYKYRIYPTKTQEQQLISVGGQTRFVFNYFLKINIDQYKIDNKFVWYNATAKQLPQLKQQFNWLKDTYSQVLQQSLRDLDQALKNIKHGSGFPKFKSKYTTPISFRYQQNTAIINNKLRLPKIGDIKIKLHRELPKYTGCTIYKTPRGWYASFVVNKQELTPITNITNPVGVDVNSEFIALSSNELIHNLKPLKKKQHKIKQLQRNLSRKRKASKNRAKASKNRAKAKLKLARVSDQIRCQRINHIHQVSSRIAKVHDLVCVETLKIDEMKRKNKYAAKAIADAGWALFVKSLEYKCNLLGHNFIKINQWLPSSKICSCCGNKKDKLSLDIREYQCDCCGNIMHRDINAAINIRNYGIQQWYLDHSGQVLPEAPVDVVADILSNFGDISATQLKQEICVL